MSKDIKVGIVLTGDSSGLRGEVKVTADDFDKLKGAANNAGDDAAKSFNKMSASQVSYAKKKAAYDKLDIRSNRDIQREIKLVESAYKRLGKSGTISQSELSRAHVKTKQRVAELNREMSGMAQASTGVSSLTGKVWALAGAYVGVQGALKVISSSDTYTSVNARLLNATKSAQEYAIAQREVGIIARETRSDWASTVDLYSRLSRATQDLDIEQSKLLTVTKALNQAGIVSGATTIEQSNAMIQLGQGLASGVLRGDELRSVLEQTPRIARMVADGMGIAFGELRKYAEEGKLTTEVVVNAITKEAATVEKEYQNMGATVSQAWGQIGDATLKVIGYQGEATGASEALAEGMLVVADNIHKITDYLPEMGFAIAAVSTKYTLGAIAARGWTGSVLASQAAIGGLIKTMIPLAAAFAVFELGKVAVEAYSASQDVATARIRNANQATEAYVKYLVPARAELLGLGIDINKLDHRNILLVQNALAKLNKEKSKGSVSIKPTPGEEPLSSTTPTIDPKVAAKTLQDAQALSASMTASFDDTFTKTSSKYNATWQALVATHGEGSAQVMALESAYQGYLDTSWAKQDAKDEARANKVVSIQAAKYARLNEAAQLSALGDEDRALAKLDIDLEGMATERQRLLDQQLWTESLETQYDEARIARAQETATILGELADEEAAKNLQRIIDGEQAGYNIKAQLQQAFTADQQVNLNAMSQNLTAYAKSAVALDKMTGKQKLGFASATFGAISGLMESGSKNQFEIGKKAARGENAVNTVTASMAAYKALAGIPYIGPGLGAAAAIAIGKVGQLNDQKIAGTQFGGGTSGGVTGPTISAGGGGASPTIDVNPTTGYPDQQATAEPAAPAQYNFYLPPGSDESYVRDTIVPIMRDLDEAGEVTILSEYGITAQRILDAA